MSASKVVKLVQGDENVDIDFTIFDRNNDNSPVNLSGATVRLYYGPIGSDTITATVICTLPNGGSDGLVRATLTAACMATVGSFEGELEITQGVKVQTVYRKQRFDVRKQRG